MKIVSHSRTQSVYPSMYSSFRSSPIRLWWRRHSFYFRKLPFRWIFLLFIGVVILVSFIPNPFSADYRRIPLEQTVTWESINEILILKEKILQDDSLRKRFKFVKQGDKARQTSTPIVILLYTKIFDGYKNCRYTVDRVFGPTCPSKDRCEWSCDRQRLHQADAIIFHAYDIQYHQAWLPNRSQTKADAIWILWSDEPPSIVNYSLFQSYQFNWTISYKLNSEVSVGAYGLFSKREDEWSEGAYNRWVDQKFYGGSRGALWFVSNCDAKQRLYLYHHLRQQQNISVEGYGRCVDYYPMHLCQAGSLCEEEYMSRFKFYLSFESTSCRDYITEKFYKSLYHGLIPIVYGPDRSDYNNFAPAHSFIHINDFQHNMVNLANYLQEIQVNYTLFSMFHQWRKTYEVIIDGRAIDRIRMCELCDRLNKRRRDDVSYYLDIEQFYYEKC